MFSRDESHITFSIYMYVNLLEIIKKKKCMFTYVTSGVVIGPDETFLNVWFCTFDEFVIC